MFKIAIFSDIHGNLEALKSILASIQKQEFDAVVCLGDVIGLGPDSEACLALILKNKIKMVLGSYEYYFVNGIDQDRKMSEEEKEYHRYLAQTIDPQYKEILSHLGLDYSITMNDKKIGFMHYPFDKIEDNFYQTKTLTENHVKFLFRNYNYDFTFFGHSHEEQIYHDRMQRVYMNIGSSGCTSSDETFYMILDYDGMYFNIYKKKCIYNRVKFCEKWKQYECLQRNYIEKITYKGRVYDKI